MRVCCYRVFVDGELWDCLLILEHNRDHVLYTTVDRLPFRVSAELRALQRHGPRDAAAAVVDANRLECVIKTLEHSGALRRSAVRTMDAVTAVDNNNIVVGVRDVQLVAPDKYRLAYKWRVFFFFLLPFVVAQHFSRGSLFLPFFYVPTCPKTERCSALASRVLSPLPARMRLCLYPAGTHFCLSTSRSGVS